MPDETTELLDAMKALAESIRPRLKPDYPGLDREVWNLCNHVHVVAERISFELPRARHNATSWRAELAALGERYAELVKAARAWRDWHGSGRDEVREGRWVSVLSDEERRLAAAVDALPTEEDVSGAERRDEWAVARGEPPWHAACADGCGCADWRTATGVLVAARDQQEARGWIAASTAPGLKLMRRTVHTGPWAEVTDEAA